MIPDVEALARRAVAPLKGRVKRREVEEAVAAAVIVGVNQVLEWAERILEPERVAAALSIRRHLGAGTLRRLQGELGAIARELRALRLTPCPKTASGDRPSAPSP